MVDKLMMSAVAALLGAILGVMRYHQREFTSGGEVSSGVVLGLGFFFLLMYLIWRKPN